MKRILQFLTVLLPLALLSCAGPKGSNIRVLVVTGGHDYQKDKFNEMFSSLGDSITFQVAELPAAYDMFLPANRDKYDILVFYHMWLEITADQARELAGCIRDGKPLVALHHSIGAFDNWPEYTEIIGGKYFHKPSTVDGKEFPASSYTHDVHFRVKISDKRHPVTVGLDDFDVFDETYKDFYVKPGVTPLLETDEQSSSPVIGWTWKYGNARIVTLQGGHDAPTFENPNFRRLLRQSIKWAYNSGK